MSDKDQFDLQAERLLPCSMLAGCTNVSDTRHNRDCIIWKRPTVAAALRELRELANKQIEDVIRRTGDDLADLRAERDQLKAQLAYAAPSVDHTCLAAETLGDHDCKRCAIDRLLDMEG